MRTNIRNSSDQHQLAINMIDVKDKMDMDSTCTSYMNQSRISVFDLDIYSRFWTMIHSPSSGIVSYKVR